MASALSLTFACYITACSSYTSMIQGRAFNRIELLNRTISSFEAHLSFPLVHKFIVDDCPAANAANAANATVASLFGWPVVRGAPPSKWREARIVANHAVAARHLDQLDKNSR